MHTVTVNLADAIAESNDRIEQARDAYADLEAFAEEEYDSVEAAPDVVYQRLQAYEQAAANFQGRANVVEQTLKRWGGPTYDEDAGTWSGDGFDLRMMSGVQAAQIEDRVGAAGVAMQQDVGAAPRDMPGERVVEVLEECVVGEPDGIGGGDPPNLGAYPSPVTLWLYEKVNNLNTAGDPNFEPSGLGDAEASTSSTSATSRGDGETTPPSPTT